MATQTKSSTTKKSTDPVDRVVEAVREAGHNYLDATEKAAKRVAELQERVGESSGIELVSTVTGAQANFTRDVAQAYVSAGRSLIS
jgi:hypothetical protein